MPLISAFPQGGELQLAGCLHTFHSQLPECAGTGISLTSPSSPLCFCCLRRQSGTQEWATWSTTDAQQLCWCPASSREPAWPRVPPGISQPGMEQQERTHLLSCSWLLQAHGEARLENRTKTAFHRIIVVWIRVLRRHYCRLRPCILSSSLRMDYINQQLSIRCVITYRRYCIESISFSQSVKCTW